MKFLGILIVSLSIAAPAMAQPMWQVADRWVCQLRLHMVADLASESARPTGQSGKRFEIDFSKGFRTSPFVDTRGQITERQYVNSAYGGFNVITFSWDGQAYPGIFVETNGEWWQTATSGYTSANREPWIAGYKCDPQIPS